MNRMLKRIYIRIINSLSWIKKKLISNPSLIISISALLISGLSVYFQFFNERHSVLYTNLTPEIDSKSKQIVIPLLIKNTGNQSEVILHLELLLEVKKKDGNFFKRISPFKNKEYYVILAPNDYKTINIVGNYKDYMFGTIEVEYGDRENFKYSPITIFDDLMLKVNVTYLTTHGNVASEEREISRVTFDKNENISRVDCDPIELKKLDLRYNDSEIVSYSIIPDAGIDGQFSIDLNDSNSIKQNIDKIELMNRILKEKTDN